MKSTPWSCEQAQNTYLVNRWGNGYFDIGENGNIAVKPKFDEPDLKIDMMAVIEEIRASQIEFPVVIRFHDILRSQVIQLNETFAKIIAEAGYQAPYTGVFPIKVNQMREVVEEVVDAGLPYHFGLEAGSKAELLAALAYNINEEALTILNGYKDEEYLRLSCLGRKLGRKLVVVIEQFSELGRLLDICEAMNVEPIIGLRVKMMVKGRGKWESSSGERAKFGLSIAEILNAVSLVNARGMGHCIQLLHFHIGSQMTDIKPIKEAVQEASNLYCQLVKMGVPMRYVDVGGGLAVDYDGSQSTRDSSRNYNLEEYVADIVHGFQATCDHHNVAHPTLVSESGRAISAYHSCVITEIVGEISPSSVDFDTSKTDDEHFLVGNMRDYKLSMDNDGNIQEAFNDIEQCREQAYNAFNLGVLSLTEMAKLETLYWQVMSQVAERLDEFDFVPEEMQEIPDRLSSMYLGNFSVFQSTADIWAIDQILPVLPIHRLNERPQKNCALVDITCDSDGKIENFIGNEEIAKHVPMHTLKPGEPYYVGIFLTGAYQDVMGDMHNLFGRLNEVHVYSHDDDPQDFYIEEYIAGSTKEVVLSMVQYTPQIMAHTIKKAVDAKIRAGDIRPREGGELIDFYEDCLRGYTYLKV